MKFPLGVFPALLIVAGCIAPESPLELDPRFWEGGIPCPECEWTEIHENDVLGSVQEFALVPAPSPACSWAVSFLSGATFGLLESGPPAQAVQPPGQPNIRILADIWTENPSMPGTPWAYGTSWTLAFIVMHEAIHHWYYAEQGMSMTTQQNTQGFDQTVTDLATSCLEPQ